MEENVLESCAIDKSETLRAIDFAKRKHVMAIDPLPVSAEAMRRHNERQQDPLILDNF